MNQYKQYKALYIDTSTINPASERKIVNQDEQSRTLCSPNNSIAPSQLFGLLS